MTVARATDKASAIPAGVSDDRRARSIRLPHRSPFAADTLLSFLGVRAVPGIEEVRDGTYVRSVRDEGGGVVVAMTPRRDHVEVQIAADGSHDIDRFGGQARRAFDLDADPVAIDAELSRDPKLAPLIARTPGIRVPSTFDGFELVIRADLRPAGLGRGSEDLSREARHGRRHAACAADGGITHLFPAAERVAELPPEAFGMPRARAQTIRRVAELVARGELDLSGDSSSEEALGRLGDLPGIGPWTLAYVAMRALRDPDAFMAGDLGVHKGFEALGLGSTRKEILKRAEHWRPWRAYAVMHLWNVHS